VSVLLTHLFFLIFLFLPCGGLSWLHVSFLLHVKYTVSYHIPLKLCLYLVPFETFSAKEWRDLETGGRGRSRSLKMVPL